jgi:hypothetical protein
MIRNILLGIKKNLKPAQKRPKIRKQRRKKEKSDI